MSTKVQPMLQPKIFINGLPASRRLFGWFREEIHGNGKPYLVCDEIPGEVHFWIFSWMQEVV